MEIYLIRHTTPLIDKGICYGQSDLAVGNDFEKDSNEIIKSLPLRIDAVYSSPLLRCKALAEKIISSSDQLSNCIIDERLIEINFGKWEMKKWCEISHEEFKAWEKDVVLNPVPGGESFSELNERVNSFLQDLLKNNFQAVVIVTHSGVIRSMLSLINKISLIDTLNITVEYGAINRLEV